MKLQYPGFTDPLDFLAWLLLVRLGAFEGSRLYDLGLWADAEGFAIWGWAGR